MTRGEAVCAFIERFCIVPEGKHVGKPIKLMKFQKKFICDIYDNPKGTSRAYLSVARKNGKSALIAGILLAHIVGPEAKTNSQIISGARSREQASLVFKLAEKMVRLSPRLSKLIKIVPSQKMLIGLPCNVEYKAISAEAGTADGLSPVLAILDEVGQVRGQYDAFIEAIETAQGAHESPLLIAISTQAATDGDLFSIWLDDAANAKDKRIVSHVYTAPEDCEIMDKKAWKAANPALGEFRSLTDIQDFAKQAERLPAKENSFRWLYLNQRIEATSPFLSRAEWEANADAPEIENGMTCYAGLDLSASRDLTAFAEYCSTYDVQRIAYDRWRISDFQRELDQIGAQVPMSPFGQGFRDMAPAVDQLERLVADRKLKHGGNPIMNMCAANAIAERDPAGNRKLNKAKSVGKIDGLVALTMALGVISHDDSASYTSPWDDPSFTLAAQ